MPFGTTTRTDILGLLFNSTALSGSWTTSLYYSLHTADPSAGNQGTSEISYTGYTRVAKARNSGTDHTVSGSAVTNATAITFGTMTAGAGGTATYLGMGLASSGATQLLASGAMSPTISVVNGTIPSFPISAVSLTLT